jgi:hypothetical protein
LNIELEEHTKADHEYYIHISTVFNLARRIKQIFESSEPAEKRAILNYLLQNPTVLAKNLEFTLRKPYNLILELSGCPDWLAWQDGFRTYNWMNAVGDLETTTKEITHLLSLL